MIILCVWNSLFMTAVVTLPSVWVLIHRCFEANKKGRIINSKNYSVPLGKRLWFNKVQVINVQVCMYWQGPNLAKYASKGIYKIRKMVTFLFFAFPLATVISFCYTVACNFLNSWTSTRQVSLCRYKNIVNEIKPSQLKNSPNAISLWILKTP